MSTFDVYASNKEFICEKVKLVSVVFVEGFDDFKNDTVFASRFFV